MKKAVLIILILIAGAGAVAYLKYGHMIFPREALPAPVVDGGILGLIDARASSRNFSDKEIDKQTLSEILWASFGKNSRGTRTIPTSRNGQNLAVYAITKDGAFAYDGANMKKIADGDLRKLFAMQDFVLNAPLTILYAGTDRENSPLHAGSAMQNAGLYAAEKGMSAVVRMMFDKAAVKKALGLADDSFPIVSMTIGWPK